MANEKAAEKDTEQLFIRARVIATRLEADLAGEKFTAADVLELAKLLQTEEMRYANSRSGMDPITGKWGSQKA